MLDLEGQSDGNKASTSPDPLSSSPESVNSEMEALMRSSEMEKDGSPGIQPKRIVVSSPGSHLRQRKKPKKLNDAKQEAEDITDGRDSPHISKCKLS